MKRVLADWSGAGALFEALSSVNEDVRQWSADEIRCRATRVLLLENESLLVQLPRSSSEWLQWLPISANRTGRWTSKVQGRVSWKKTAVRKWPPEEVFVVRKRRTADNLPASVLAWTYSRIQSARPNRDSGTVSSPIDRALSVMGRVVESIEGADTTEPHERELHTIRSLGGPWPIIATLALRLKSFERSGAEEYARRLIQPEILDRMFQLGLLGEVLLGLESLNLSTVSVRPITGSSGAVYATRDGYWSIWWEAASIWHHFGLSNLRQEISREAFSEAGSSYRAKPDRPDILLVGKNREVLVLESKYPVDSQTRGYVASGIPQAYFYAKQLAATSPLTHAFSVGPNALVPNIGYRNVDGLKVGMAPDTQVRKLVIDFIAQSGHGYEEASDKGLTGRLF